MSKLEQALAEADDIEAAEHTADPAAPLPDHVKVSQPNRTRSKVLQVRLNPEEMEALEAIADRRGLPVSTVARGQILRLLADDASSGSNMWSRLLDGLAQLNEAVGAISQQAPGRLFGDVRFPVGSFSLADAESPPARSRQ